MFWNISGERGEEGFTFNSLFTTKNESMIWLKVLEVRRRANLEKMLFITILIIEFDGLPVV